MSSTAQTILDKGTALMSEERWVEAINLFLSEPELLTSTWEVAWNAGWAHYKTGDYPKALELLAHSTEIAPQNAISVVGTGCCSTGS